MENNKATHQSLASEVAHEAEDRLEDTTQSYLDQAGVGVDSHQIVSLIREHPLKCAGAAAAAGFVVGGGLSGALGLAVLGFAGRTAVRATLSDLLGVVRDRRTTASTGYAENI
jgi:hypothetical protein